MPPAQPDIYAPPNNNKSPDLPDFPSYPIENNKETIDFAQCENPLTIASTIGGISSMANVTQCEPCSCDPVARLEPPLDNPVIERISVENSTNITFGNRTFYQGPVTVKKFQLENNKWKSRDENAAHKGQLAMTRCKPIGQSTIL